MANRKQVAMLRRSVAEWNEWRDHNQNALPDLRGADLRGCDLRGVNLQEADIRSTNFGRRRRRGEWQTTNLTGADLSGAKAGLQRRYFLVQLSIAAVLGLLMGLFVMIAAIFTAGFVTTNFDEIQTNAGGLWVIKGSSVFCSLVPFWVITRRGFTFRSAGTIAGALTVVGMLAIVGASALGLRVGFAFASALSGSLSGGFAGILAFAGVGAFAGTLAFARTAAFVLAIFFALVVAMVGALAGASSGVESFAGTGAATVFFAGSSLFMGWYVARLAKRGDERFTLIRQLGLEFDAIGGTHFTGADLTQANLKKSKLKSTTFHNATLIRTNFRDAHQLHHANPGRSLLANFQILDLLTSPDGRYGKNLSGINLRGAYLADANLENVNLSNTDLAEADLTGASLKDANLREANCIGTNLTKAYLTGACIDVWNIDHTTKLENADCQHIYMLSNGSNNPKDWSERRPSSGAFEPGEFTKLFEQVFDTVDLIFRNGVDWQSFIMAFDKLRIENEEVELQVQSIENKGDGVVVVRVQTSDNADKEKLHRQFTQMYGEAIQALEEQYRSQLKDKSARIEEYQEEVKFLRRSSTEIHQVIQTMANKQQQETTRIINITNGDYRETTVRDNAQYAEGKIINQSNTD